MFWTTLAQDHYAVTDIFEFECTLRGVNYCYHSWSVMWTS